MRREIRTRYPKIMRRVSGYNLDEFIKPQPFNLSRILVGSEGTLGTVVEAKMRLVPKPKWTAMDVIHFDNDQEALECSQVVLQTVPYAMESTDKMILNLARGNIEQSRKLGFVQGNPDALLMVEYAGETENEVKERVYKLEELRKKERIGYTATLAFKPEEVKAIWGVRKAGLGLLLGTKGDKKPIAFVEDTAVAPAKTAGIHQTLQRDHHQPRRGGRLLWPLLRRLHAYPSPDQSQRTERNEKNGFHRRLRFQSWSSSSTEPCRESTATGWPAAISTRSFSARFSTKHFARLNRHLIQGIS